MNSQNNLSFSVTFEQTVDFIRNRFLLIAIVSIILALFSTIISNLIFDPSLILAQLYYIQSPTQVFTYLIRPLILLYILCIICISITLAVLYNLSINDKLNPSLILPRLLPIALNILGYTIIYSIILIALFILFSLIMFILSFVLSERVRLLTTILFLIAVALIYFSLFYYFLASTIQPSTKTFLQRFIDSHKFIFSNWQSPILIVLISGLINIVLNWFSALLGNNIIVGVIFSTLSTIISFFVFSFFYRLYTVKNNIELPKLDENNKQNQQIIS